MLVVNSASILSFERGTIIWMFAPKKGSYLLFSGGLARFVPESAYCEQDWCRGDSKESISRFEKKFGSKRPSGLHTPYGQSAAYFDANPDEFKKFGWLAWSCELSENSLYYQKLSNGFAAGVYPSTRLAGADYQSEVIFVNESDGSYSVVGDSGVREPSCR